MRRERWGRAEPGKAVDPARSVVDPRRALPEGNSTGEKIIGGISERGSAQAPPAAAWREG